MDDEATSMTLDALSGERQVRHTRRARGADGGHLEGKTRTIEVEDASRDLQVKLAHIQWRKHANDKNIRCVECNAPVAEGSTCFLAERYRNEVNTKAFEKSAINTTKSMYERDLMLQLSCDGEGERERWTRAVIRDELARPAEISDVFLRKWEKREEENRRRQLKEAQLHLKSIKRVELAVKAKTDRKAMGDVVGTEGGDLGNGKGKQSERVEEQAPNLLRNKLEALRRDVKNKRRELRRSATKELNGVFRARNFKTGRGRC